MISALIIAASLIGLFWSPALLVAAAAAGYGITRMCLGRKPRLPYPHFTVCAALAMMVVGISTETYLWLAASAAWIVLMFTRCEWEA